MELRAARDKAGLTQKQVAKEARVSEISYQMYEYDKREPRVRTAIRVAKAVNSTVEAIWGEETEKEPDGNPAY